MLVVFTYFYLAMIFLVEGFGVNRGRELVLLLIVTMPLFLVLGSLISKKNLFVSRVTGLFLIVFIVLSLIPTLFSIDRQISFEQWLYLLSLVLIYVWSVNNKQILRRWLDLFIIVMGVVLCCVSRFFQLFPTISLFSVNDFNLIILNSFVHNHLGDFLGLAIIVTTFKLFEKKRLYLIVLLLIFIYHFLFAFSRTAYLSLFITLIISLIKIKNKHPIKIILICMIIIIAGAALLLVNKEFHNLLHWNSLYKTLETVFHYQDKSLFSNRDIYFRWAWQSIIERPFAGVGLGNFYQVSLRYSLIPFHGSMSSMNIFLDYFAEGGLIFGFFIIVFAIYLYKRITFNSSIIYLFLTFQTYWMHKFYVIFLLFILMIGLSNKDNIKATKINVNKVLLVSAVILFIISNRIIISQALLNVNNPTRSHMALMLYPLNKLAIFQRAYQQTSLFGFNYYVKRYLRVSQASIVDNYLLGKTYLEYGNKHKALNMFIKVYYWSPFYFEDDFGNRAIGGKMLFKRIFLLKKKLIGVKNAMFFADQYLTKVSSINKINNYPDLIFNDAKYFCKELYGNKCPYDLEYTH